jgi:hypothetical protein
MSARMHSRVRADVFFTVDVDGKNLSADKNASAG